MDSELSFLYSQFFELLNSENHLKEDEGFKTKLKEIVKYAESIPRPVKRLVRVYVGPCMDLIHSGHFNFLRQAKTLGDVLVVGVISDEEIQRAKGPPVMNIVERAAVIEACK
jgi:cytidyltransferase-related domain